MEPSKRIIVTVDSVLLTIKDEQLQVALIEREYAPFKGSLALPGGYVHFEDGEYPTEDEDTYASAMRVLKSKANVEGPYLEQLQTFSGKKRDPRGWSVSIAYFAVMPFSALQSTGADHVQYYPVEELPLLAFDHTNIITAAVSRLRNKSEYSSLPVFLCPPVFTRPQLQRYYELIRGEPIQKSTFNRKMDELGLLEEVPGVTENGKVGIPAKMYRLNENFRHTLSTTNRGFN